MLKKWLWLSVLVIALDQATKFLAETFLAMHEPVPVLPSYNLMLTYNTGAAFSFLAGAGGWQRWFFMGIGVAAATFIIWMLRTHPHQKLFSFAMASLLGGAIGNVIDRVWHGYVVDFLDFHWNFLSPLFHQGHFPAFNIADTAITIGAICLILDEILRVRKAR